MGIEETASEWGPIPLSPARRRAVTGGVLVGMALAALEATVVGAAMPTIVAALGGLDHYSWVFSVYLLTATVTVPLWGKLSDLYGRRPTYQAGMALFLFGSVLCGASSSMLPLVAARAVQGVGAGALVPLAMTILADIYTMSERARMQALFSGVWGISSVVGPLVGGFLTEHVSWRWVFFVNVPIGLAAAGILQLALVEPRRHGRPSIDWRGAATLTAALTLLLLGVELRGHSVGQALALIAAIALGIVFLSIERRATDPLVPPALFRNRVLSVAVAAGVLLGMSMFGVLSFVPLFAQGALGVGASEAGRTLTPLMLGWVSFSVIGGRLMLKLSYRPMVLAGCALIALGLGLLSTFSPGSPRFLMTTEMTIIGAGLGLSMFTLLIAVQQSVPRPQLGLATALNQLARMIGGAVGVALMGALLASGLAARLGPRADIAALLAPHDAARGRTAAVTPAQRAAFAETLHVVFRVGAGLALGAFGIVAVFLPRTARRPSARDAGEPRVAAEATTL